jgi:superfamily II DNA or RNA helicase
MTTLTHFPDVDRLSPGDFELFVRDVFAAAGWTDLRITQPGVDFAHGDGGVDIFGSKSGRNFAIEVKQRGAGNTVDVSALNQLVTGAALEGVQNRILVTNSYFTSEVTYRALRLGVELVDRDELQNLWIARHSEIGRRVKLRKYQQGVIDEIMELRRSGKQRFLIEMATGLGKTYTAAHLVRSVLESLGDGSHRVLFVAHQVEILKHALTEFRNVFGIGKYSFSACFDGADPEPTDFVFASFDTLFMKLSTLGEGEFDVVVVDEAHHAPANVYSTVVRHFAPDTLVGLTATPFRADARDVLVMFGGEETHVGRYDLAWALRHNKLAFPRYKVLMDDLDPESVAQLRAGLSIGDIDKRLFLHKRDDEVIRQIESAITAQGIESPKGIVFCSSIAHMRHLLPFFPPESATFVHGGMDGAQRRQNISAFRDGRYRYILVCNLFNEGIDIPETNVLVFLRRTCSRTIWLQQLGRGLRKTATKETVLVLDFVGSLERLDEVQQLARDVQRTPVDVEEREQEPRPGPHDDFTLEVEYEESAAEVLKLVEDMEYRLRSRRQALEPLYRYVEIHSAAPLHENLMAMLEEFDGAVTCDQVATHFGSYVGYLSAAFGDENEHRAVLMNECQAYVADFRERQGISPSSKAVSHASHCDGLPMYTAPEVEQILAELPHPGLEEVTAEESAPRPALPPDPPSLVSDDESPFDDADQLREAARARLSSECRATVRTQGELRALPQEKQDEIRALFTSEFLFLRLLREDRSREERAS